MDSLTSILISLLVLFAGTGLGRLLRRLWRAGDRSPLEEFVIDTSLGLGVLSLLVFGYLLLMSVGAVDMLHMTRLPRVTLAAAAVVGFVSTVLALIIARRKEKEIRSRNLTSVLIGTLLIVLAIAALIPALAPPSMGDWDSLAYHLAVPKLYLQHGGMHYIDFTSHSNFPFLMEMLYTPGLGVNNPVAAKMMHYWMGMLMVLAVMMLAKRHFSAKAAPLAGLGIAGLPIVLWEATTAYVDLATALYTVLCVHLLLNYFDTKDRRYLIGCGISAGFAASTKMTGLALIPILICWLIIDRFAADRRIEWKPGLLLASVACLVCAPWYLKSYIYTGNPVYPFFYSAFGGRDWTSVLAAQYARSQAAFGMGHSITSLLMLPYNITFHSEKFYDTRGLYIGPIFLVAIPLLFIANYRSRKLSGLLGFFAALLLVWFGLTHQSRYLIPAFAVLAIIIAVIVYNDDRFTMTRRMVTGVLVGTALFGLLTMLPLIRDTLPVVLGGETREDYLARTLDIYPAQQYINAQTAKMPYKVALYRDTRGFYLNKDYVWADPYHNKVFTRDYNSLDDYISTLKQQGVTHLMVNFRSMPPHNKARGIAKWIYQGIDEGRLIQEYPDDEYENVGVFRVK